MKLANCQLDQMIKLLVESYFTYKNNKNIE